MGGCVRKGIPKICAKVSMWINLLWRKYLFIIVGHCRVFVYLSGFYGEVFRARSVTVLGQC